MAFLAHKLFRLRFAHLRLAQGCSGSSGSGSHTETKKKRFAHIGSSGSGSHTEKKKRVQLALAFRMAATPIHRPQPPYARNLRMAATSIWQRPPYGSDLPMAATSVWQRPPYTTDPYRTATSICQQPPYGSDLLYASDNLRMGATPIYHRPL
ncbi:hypothetical protein L211DRAFT_231130 [Terfezia boudieri ATCC MYA-4762]|uniref:Uncharacterized protein n=1 Tax=Terfezia boudieri ATCC MYA-4762 TaxID=1051890 RepID=A0A3N4L5B2_9PEZI|nr:hypothetical protein L211DRAFT_231130 [Terfezia boudieri ATCC MYA-4762]